MRTTSFRLLMVAAALALAAGTAGCSSDGGGQPDTGADVQGDTDMGGDTDGQDGDVSEDPVPDGLDDTTADPDTTTDTTDVSDEDTEPVEPTIWDDDDFDPTQGFWSQDFAIAGAAGEIGARVNAIAEDSAGNIYIGGEFTTVGGVRAENVARWTGSAWLAMTDEFGTGPDITVNAIAVADDDTVCVGGEGGGGWFGFGRNAVKCWDGEAWNDLGPDIDGTLYAMRYIDGQLWIGGDFSRIDPDPFDEEDPLGPRGLAVWNGSEFVPATPGGEGTGAVMDEEWEMGGEPVYAIGENPAGEPCIGGMFSEIDGVPSSFVACLGVDGWYDLSEGLNSVVRVLHSDGTRFFAGGYFGGGIAELVGGEWSAFQGGVEGGMWTYVMDIATVGDAVYVGGQFGGAAGGVSSANMIAWRDDAWRSLDGGVAFTVGGISITFGVNALWATDAYVYAGGLYTQAGDIGAINLSRWNLTSQDFEVVFDVSKEAFGTGGPVAAFASDAEGNVYLGGSFSFIGSSQANNVAMRSVGGAWRPLGSGLGEGGSESVQALVVTPSGRLYAGGWFIEAGILGANFFSWWNGSSWRAAPDQLDSSVSAMAACANDEVVVVGQFDRAGDEVDGLEARGLAIFDGAEWRTLPLGEGEEYGRRAVACAGTDIFTEIGVTTTELNEEEEAVEVTRWYVAVWDAEAEAWERLGEAFGDPSQWRTGPHVFDLDWYDGTLYAAGDFQLIGEESVLAVASWDGESWSSLGAGLRTLWDFSPAQIYDIHVKQNGVFAIGIIGGSGTNEEDDSIVTPFDHIAWFDNETEEWSGLGPVVEGTFGEYRGLNDLGEALLIHDGSLFVGGPFNAAGGEPALGLGQWVYRPEAPQ
jgi:trimeric autotransporter adhesin